ncbi:MAG: lamin tail domain-containing protein [Acidobacteria bacterium]|nr:lamin tail domain-containing protein [Acidobacteriota bacterium]
MKQVLFLFALACAPVVAQPTVTAVLDGAAYTNNIAQGSVFVVKGTGLSAVGNVTATAPNYPTSLNNVSLAMTPASAGAAVSLRMVYTYNVSGVNQLAAVLPSTTPPGLYDLRVTNGSATSAPIRLGVVARKPGIVTASGDGVGPAQATLDGKLILQRTANLGKIGEFDTRAARLGERVDLWGTGLGPDPASDSGGTSGDQTVVAQIRVIVDGIEVTPAYAGRSQGYPGLDQIVFNLPNSTALSCTVDLQVRSGGVLSNVVTIATSVTEACPAGPALRINEVESNGGTPGDWVELFNPGATPVNLTGFIFKDNDDSRNYVIPSATIPPGGYLLLEEADFNFGLGSPDAARLYRPDGTLAASYSWTPHAATTYGRCPNGAGAFTTTTSSTKGASNDCSIAVKINEIESDSGTPGDWVEFLNTGTAAVDVSGFTFRDSDNARAYTIPAGTAIAAGGYLVTLLSKTALTLS